MAICDCRLLAVAVIVAGAGCAARGAQPEALSPAPFASGAPASRRPPATLSRAEGARLWSALCRSCHGADGRGETPLGRDLDVRPSDLTRCNFKYRSTPSGALPTDDDLLRTLYVGLPGTAMPALGPLLGLPALRALVREVKDRCDRFAEEPPEPPLAIPPPPLYDQASVDRGRLLYVRERCASCHGDRGRGDGPAARGLKDLLGRPVRPRDHARGVFRGGFRRVDIYRAFSTGLDGTPMPALPESVPAADRWDLAHYVVSLSHQRSRIVRALEDAPTWYEPLRARGLPWR